MVTGNLLRLYLFGLVVAAGFALLIWRLWVVQIEHHQKYLAALPRAGKVVQRVPGVRGDIRDRNGIPLATNRMSYEIKLDLREIKRLYESRHKEIPKHVYEATDRYGTRRKREEADIFKMYDEEVKPQLERLGLAEPLNSDLMRRHYRTNRGVIPFIYRKEVPFDAVALVAEHGRFLDGVTISSRPLRHYPYGAMLGHVLGYVKQTGVLEVPEGEEARSFDFYEGDDIGVAGIEATMDGTLRGRPGRHVFPRDEHGKIVYEELPEERVEPVKGSDVYLSIDLRLQYITERAMRDADVGRGAAVVMDPASGEVLAMVSVPNFDPNNFIPEVEVEKWKAYNEDPTEPLMNRVLLSYAPGSTFKIPVALAGCVGGISNRTFNCSGSVMLGSRASKCWIADKGGAHGTINLSDAIMHSCNAFFYKYGIATGIKTIDTVCHWFGLGEPTGIDLPYEAPGRVPNERILALMTGERWTEAQTAFASIGQGLVEATPLQMCNVAATVANGGICYKPKLVSKVHDHADHMDTAFPDRLRHDLRQEGAKPESIELVRKGMWKVINGDRGTAKSARSKGFESAGKTGTAQTPKFNRVTKSKENDTWFIAFAPYDNPKFAVCIFIENGNSGGGTAAPIAARIIKQGMAMEAGAYNPPVQALPEAKGHYRKLEVTKYLDDPVDAILAEQAASEDSAIVTPDERPVRAERQKKRKPQPPAPKLKSKANAEGSNVRNQSRPAPPARPAAEPSPPPRKPGILRRLLPQAQGR